MGFRELNKAIPDDVAGIVHAARMGAVHAEFENASRTRRPREGFLGE